MINIQEYIENLTSLLQDAFGERLLYVGLQGSYMRCVAEMLTLADEKGISPVRANIYSFNTQSRKMFLACGFRQTAEEWFEY